MGIFNFLDCNNWTAQCVGNPQYICTTNKGNSTSPDVLTLFSLNSTRCYYCAIPYAVIAKYETYNEDLK